MLTAGDVNKIVGGNFAPDVKKLTSEIEANLGNHAALHAIGASVVAEYGQEGLRKVMQYLETIHAEEFSNSETVDHVIGRGFRGTMMTKGWIAEQRFSEVYRGASGRNKKTTKAEAIAQHIAGLVKLLQNEPDTIVGPILDNLLERVRRQRAQAAGATRRTNFAT